MNEDREEVRKNHSKEHSSLKSSILTSSEGHIFLTGALLALLYVSWLALGMFSGYTAKLSHSTVIFVNMLIETIIVLIFYPLFIFSWKHLLVIRVLRNMMARAHKAAEAIGCVIGFLLGLHPWLRGCFKRVKIT